MGFNFLVVLCKKKNPICGFVLDGCFQPSGCVCWVEPPHSLGSTQHGHPLGWKRPSTTEPHIRFLYAYCGWLTAEKLCDIHSAPARISKGQGAFWEKGHLSSFNTHMRGSISTVATFLKQSPLLLNNSWFLRRGIFLLALIQTPPNISQLGVDFAFVFWINLVLQVSKFMCS